MLGSEADAKCALCILPNEHERTGGRCSRAIKCTGGSTHVLLLCLLTPYLLYPVHVFNRLWFLLLALIQDPLPFVSLAGGECKARQHITGMVLTAMTFILGM